MTPDIAKLPRHVAIIMDGNGRWAQARGLDRSAGHVEGVTTVRRITEAASEAGVGYLTLYAFSTENWNRPQDEVDALMHLIGVAIERETPDLIKNNVRLEMIGDFDRMPDDALERLHGCIKATSHCTGLCLILALSYSARWDLSNASRLIAREVAEGKLSAADITELLIRTGGDCRVSNFLLWEIAYAELSFTPTYWPDYSKEEFFNALKAFGTKERRFGLTSAQVAEGSASRPSDTDSGTNR